MTDSDEGRALDAALWREYSDNPCAEAKEKIIGRYLPLVKYVLGRMPVSAPSGLDYEDLLSFGVFGLIDAVERFDMSKGFSFQTFAVPRIRGAILDELRKYDWVSRTGREKLQRLNKAIEKVLRDKGSITDDDVMREMGVDDKTYREALDLVSRNCVISLDEVVALGDGDVALDGVIADESDGTVTALELQDEIASIADALSRLPERERQVISFYYYEGLTLKEIGRILDVTESRVSQIHGKAIAALKALIAT
ncbi:MAG: FliA/WhiG family RNA polymerase sigma factor [Synergistaceae bacterium]|jgi:RNA polymerase sigma factor for flagellar operon FliA|nr:FliA/WhiG family RNA polymerase sigma factor [Synergistaceae bacterium]